MEEAGGGARIAIQPRLDIPGHGTAPQRGGRVLVAEHTHRHPVKAAGHASITRRAVPQGGRGLTAGEVVEVMAAQRDTSSLPVVRVFRLLGSFSVWRIVCLRVIL